MIMINGGELWGGAGERQCDRGVVRMIIYMCCSEQVLYSL